MFHRRRGTAIVETSKGILVASGKRKIFLLPGGGAEKWESRRKAAIRELREETGLRAYESHFLFEFDGFYSARGNFQDHHKVFLVKANGYPRPQHEIKYVKWYVPGSNIHLSGTTRKIIEGYYGSKQ